MKHACMSAMMAVVLVVMGAGAAQAQNRPDERRPEFPLTPAMARALSLPVPPLELKPGPPAEKLQQVSSTAQPGRRPASRVAGGLAFGFIGMLAGAGFGAAAARGGGGDSAMTGVFYGTIIGGATGAVFGAWLAGR